MNEKEIEMDDKLRLMGSLKQQCKAWADEYVKNGGDVDDDSVHYIFETAMQLVLGKDIFEELNEEIKDE